MKQLVINRTDETEEVTPCVGVWIETLKHSDCTICEKVTPCVGVWIETPKYTIDIINAKSHPAWVCGLKQGVNDLAATIAGVTPCVGVWIETRILL